MFLSVFMEVSAFQNDIDDDWCAYHGGYGIERNDALFAGQHADDIAQQGHCHARKDGGGNELTVVVCGEHEAGDVGYGKTDEAHWTAERCGDG